MYDMREKAGLSVGGTQPALNRLLKAGFVQAENPSLRGKQRFQLTASGRRALASEWKDLIEHAPKKPLADTESILRLIAIALNEGDKESARKLIDRAVRDRRARAQAGREKIRIQKNSSVADLYKTLLQASETARLEAEARQFAAVSRKIRPNRRSKSRK
jgi:DNA-binding PadR family transcriptional regulator